MNDDDDDDDAEVTSINSKELGMKLLEIKELHPVFKREVIRHKFPGASGMLLRICQNKIKDVIHNVRRHDDGDFQKYNFKIQAKHPHNDMHMISFETSMNFHIQMHSLTQHEV